MRAFVIAAPMTGSGKTTVTLGLLAAFASRGVKVQPFKVGPDFIDTGLHQLASGCPSHNLDGWMLSRKTNLELFEAATVGKDLAIVEGVMGLFDGFEGSSNAGSTAEIAAWLDLPIILVIDASRLARTVAAVVHGFQDFDPTVRIAGVILNRVAGESHFQILRDAIKTIPILGWLPSNPAIEIQERHLGLLTAGEPEARARVERIRDFVAAHIDVDRILDLPELSGGFVGTTAPTESALKVTGKNPVRVALAHDVAFSFYYEANRNAIERMGARIIEFSPIRDRELPDADLLYIGGGYPELYRRELEANRPMRSSIRNFIESGKRFYAECGGLMYLSKRIDDSEMVGVFPTDIQLEQHPVNFGYSEIITLHPSILGPAGTSIRGHQFHYSKCEPVSPDPIYAIKQRTREYHEGWHLPNGIASYVHLHFLSNPAVLRSVLQS